MLSPANRIRPVRSYLLPVQTDTFQLSRMYGLAGREYCPVTDEVRFSSTGHQQRNQDGEVQVKTVVINISKMLVEKYACTALNNLVPFQNINYGFRNTNVDNPWNSERLTSLPADRTLENNYWRMFLHRVFVPGLWTAVSHSTTIVSGSSRSLFTFKRKETFQRQSQVRTDLT